MEASAINAIKQLPNRPYWLQKSEKRAPLAEDISADIVIIGAGYTGLWTAYYLLKNSPTLRIVILEKEQVGFGASGRNGGWASSIFPVSLSKVTKDFSKVAAVEVQLALNHAVDEIGNVLTEESIDADYCKEGYISIARTPAQLTRANAAVNETQSFGLLDQWQLMNADTANEKLLIKNSLGAIYTPHCAVIHPGKLVKSLAQTVEKMGATIYEQSEVIKIDSKKVQTAHHSVSAPHIVRATESYSCQLENYKRSTIPLYSLALATEPIPKPLQEKLKLNHRMAFNDMRHLLVYAQMTADGRLVIGGRGAPYHYGSKISSHYDIVDSVHQKILQTTTDFFPDLKDLKVTHRWGGSLAIARDWYPSVGLDRMTGIAWAGQYAGDGVTMSNLSGRILANLLLDIDEPINHLPFVNRISRTWESEPFRWFGINMGLTVTSFGDKEEKLTGKPSIAVSLLEKLTNAQ